jgi:enediyne biosynthesis protein E4
MKTAAVLCLLAAPAFVRSVPAQGMGGRAKAVARGSARARLDLPSPKVEFRDIAALTAPNVYGGVSSKKYILEMTGNGAAVFDFDNDGRPDIFLVNGARLDSSKATSRLYHNEGEGKFRDVTPNSGLTQAGWGQGVCAGDIDNDGLTDLFVTYFGHNVLYRNLGGGRFEDVTAKFGLPAAGRRWGTGCAFLDFDRDGYLDLFVSNYLDFDLDKAALPGANPFCNWKGLQVFCGPRGYPGGQNLLYHSERGHSYTDVTKRAGMQLSDLHYNLSVVSSDFDDDGWPDIYVACDSTPSLLYRNNHDGTFAEIAVGRGVAYGPDGQEQGSMGVAAGDYDNDGRIDLVKTNFIHETSTLYHNGGDAYFDDQTYPGGLGVNTGFVGWGVSFLDIDQDGWKDIFMANGHIYPELAGAKLNEEFRQRKTVYWNLRNGAFRDITSEAGEPLTTPRVSRGVATGDFDGDGAPEIVVVNMNEPPSLLKNFGPRGNALLIEAVGTKSNRSAIGARVIVTAGKLRQVDEVRSGGSYASQSDFRLHFGLGSATRVDEIEIRWPGGAVEKIHNVQTGQCIRVQEGRGIVKATAFCQRPSTR